MSILEQTDRITFGLFEVDLSAGELWKAGYKVRLARQPFKVLTTLLARPGEVVTREELQLEVWGTNTTVDFERALAGAINKVREALGDSAENPRFVQTLPKRGYRFIAPVSSAHAVLPGSVPVGGHHTRSTSEETPTASASVTEPSRLNSVPSSENKGLREQKTSFVNRLSPPRHSWSPWPSIVASMGILLLCSAAAILWLLRKQPETAPLRMSQLTRIGAISTGPPNLENLLTLATDGNRILTSVMKSGRPRLSTISLSTGEVEELALPQELASSSLTDISRDGLRLLLKGHSSSASEQSIWIVPSSGGSALRVGGILAHDASWMPDGASILYAHDNDLSVIRLSDGVSNLAAHLSGRAFWMRWSPDGKLLRFTLLNPVTHSSEIWELDSKGGLPRRLRTSSTGKLSACCGTWTADGSSYVFQAGDNLWKLKGVGWNATLTQLTNGPLRFLSPVPDRSGSRIFYVGLEQPLGMQELGSGGVHPAPPFLTNATRVDFSRDGEWVAWTDNDEKLWRSRTTDGSDKVQLTPGYLEVFMAHWSPDGKKLAIMAREPGKLWRTYLIDADGGTPEPLLNEERNAADPGWSADGKSLVFGREPELMGKENGPHTIQIVELATMKTQTVPGSEGMFSPRWSPDGRWIVALSLDQKSLMIYDVAQREWKELARTSAADPIWSADSKSVYVHAFLEDQQPILKIDVPDGRVHMVADLSAFHDRATINYFFGGLTPANQPLVQPRIGTGNLYSLDLNVR